MIEIRHKISGRVLQKVDRDTLREANLFRADLRGANLSSVDLSGAYLREADLSTADLSDANLSETILSKANLSEAHLRRSNLSRADLSAANLIETDLTEANLPHTHLFGCNLRRANLRRANLSEANLTDADLTESLCWSTYLTSCFTLTLAKGLEAIQHRASSFLDVTTLRSCVNDLPNVFLRGVGYNDEEIETLRAMYKPGGISYFSCFLSSAEADLPFVTRLLNDLQANGVTCWHYKDDMQGGLDWKPQINEAIKFHDKLVLVCSRRSVYRENVVHEIIQAIDSERETGNQKLFPIRLDNHIFSNEMMEEAREMVTTQRWRENWVIHIKRKHILDFSNWENNDAYKKEFKNLIRDLKQPVSPAMKEFLERVPPDIKFTPIHSIF